jgi:hypothetical protein
MAWKAILKTVQENPVPNDTVTIQIEFMESGTNKTFTKEFNIAACNFQDPQNIKDLVNSELDKLSKFDVVISSLKSFMGKEVK